MREGQLDGLLDFLDLRLEAADIGVALQGALSTFMTDTIGSVSSASRPTIELTLWCVSSEQPGSSWSLSTNDMMFT